MINQQIQFSSFLLSPLLPSVSSLFPLPTISLNQYLTWAMYFHWHGFNSTPSHVNLNTLFPSLSSLSHHQHTLFWLQKIINQHAHVHSISINSPANKQTSKSSSNSNSSFANPQPLRLYRPILSFIHSFIPFHQHTPKTKTYHHTNALFLSFTMTLYNNFYTYIHTNQQSNVQKRTITHQTAPPFHTQSWFTISYHLLSSITPFGNSIYHAYVC